MAGYLQTQIAAASGFSAAQVTIGDAKVYAKGKTPCAVIQLRPRVQHERESMGGGHLHNWSIEVEVGAQWRDAVNGPVNLEAAYQAVIDRIDQYPNLGQGAGSAVREAHLEAANLEPIVMAEGTLKFAKVLLTFMVSESLTVAEAE